MVPPPPLKGSAAAAYPGPRAAIQPPEGRTWDEEALEHVNLVANSGGNEGIFTPAEFFNGMVSGISVAIARGVGEIILQGQQISMAALSGIRIGPP